MIKQFLIRIALLAVLSMSAHALSKTVTNYDQLLAS